MDVFVARQPIMNRKQQVVGYEMLYRDGPENVFPRGVNGTEATVKILSNTHLNRGLGAFTQNKTALINFNQESLTNGLAKILPPNKVIIEILETVEPNDEVFATCQQLFKAGYRLALDDFVYQQDWQRFFPLVKLIKIDVENTPLNTVSKFVRYVKQNRVGNIQRIKLLAERIEREDDFQAAADMGFDYFQGYFFAKPAMIKTKDVSPQHALLLAVYHESLRPEINVNKLETLFKQDPGITYKLLTYLNSGAFALNHEVSSIKTALVYLGQDKMRRFVALMVTATLQGSKPNHLIENAIFRARFCELIAERCNPALMQNAFFVGLLSQLDALLDRPMAEVLKHISVSPEIAEALTFSDEEQASENGQWLKDILNLVKVHETGSWRGMQRSCARLRLEEGLVPGLHANAIAWVSEFAGKADLQTQTEAVI